MMEANPKSKRMWGHRTVGETKILTVKLDGPEFKILGMRKIRGEM